MSHGTAPTYMWTKHPTLPYPSFFRDPIQKREKSSHFACHTRINKLPLLGLLGFTVPKFCSRDEQVFIVLVRHERCKRVVGSQCGFQRRKEAIHSVTLVDTGKLETKANGNHALISLVNSLPNKLLLDSLTVSTDRWFFS